MTMANMSNWHRAYNHMAEFVTDRNPQFAAQTVSMDIPARRAWTDKLLLQKLTKSGALVINPDHLDDGPASVKSTETVAETALELNETVKSSLLDHTVSAINARHRKRRHQIGSLAVDSLDGVTLPSLVHEEVSIDSVVEALRIASTVDPLPELPEDPSSHA